MYILRFRERELRSYVVPRSIIFSAFSFIPLSTVKLKTAARSSFSSAYWPTNFFYEEPSRAKREIEREREGKPPVFLHTETKVRVMMYDSRGWAGI